MATPIPANRAHFTLSDVARATGGALRPGVASEVTGVTTDSRADVAGKLFLALEGESFDGHAFVADAVKKGAAAVVVSRDVELPASVGVVRVPSTLVALGALAKLHRQRWGGSVIAVGGSAGKTTTKTAVAAVLEAVAPGAVHVSRGNLNNLVGVPMVLLGLEAAHRVAVVEVGTNLRGEVETLARMSAPDVAVLTLVAIEHSAGIGDLDAIEAEEGDLLAALGPAGTAVGNSDDPRVRRQLARSPAELRIGYGTTADADYRVVERGAIDLERSRVVIDRPASRGRERVSIETRLIGLPGALAVAAALAVADRVAGAAVEAKAVEGALAAVGGGEPGRLRPLELADGSVVVDDTYNANPASVLAAVETAKEIARARGARLVLVLGEMRELGPLSRSEHEKLGTAVAGSGAACLIAVEGDAKELARAAEKAGLASVFAADAVAALPLALARVQAGDVVLVKASRGVRAERIVEGLVSARGRTA